MLEVGCGVVSKVDWAGSVSWLVFGCNHEIVDAEQAPTRTAIGPLSRLLIVGIHRLPHSALIVPVSEDPEILRFINVSENCLLVVKPRPNRSRLPVASRHDRRHVLRNPRSASTLIGKQAQE
jgi:hypothetical protein